MENHKPNLPRKMAIAFGVLIALLFAIFLYRSARTPQPPLEKRPTSDTISNEQGGSRQSGIVYQPITAQELSKKQDRILSLFPEQLVNPQKKNRFSQCQFGYNLFLTSVPLYPITEFINPKKLGTHSYGGQSLKEDNGSLYTCSGGFIDFAHMRTAADWTTHLTFTILTEQKDFELPEEAGKLQLHFDSLQTLSLEDIAAIAQRIAFERLVWHEVASWYYHPPNHFVMEQQSTFTPEDVFSNLLGTTIGKKVALRLLKAQDTTLTYEQVTTEEIEKEIALLKPVEKKHNSKEAYDIVDRFKQQKLPAAKRNKDVWWDSDIVFMDPRYVFKRDVETGPEVKPWLVPNAGQIGCPATQEPATLWVPEKTSNGHDINNYYTFTIKPDSSLFYSKRNGKQLHAPFGSFTTANIKGVLADVKKEMEKKLLPGFDKRNNDDPVARYDKVKRVLFKN
ncbi:MAG: DUF4056 domain-containing protein [Chitinophagales bacterium]|nr:DUF4056 domain-containing protein [Chitinophagales bacterium]